MEVTAAPNAGCRAPNATDTAAAWWRSSPLAWLPLLLIRIYQLVVSPLLGPRCRFEPSCSQYAATCLRRFGLIRGGWLAARRVLRCHPFNPGGHDPPPDVWTDARAGRGRRRGIVGAAATAATAGTGGREEIRH